MKRRRIVLDTFKTPSGFESGNKLTSDLQFVEGFNEVVLTLGDAVNEVQIAIPADALSIEDWIDFGWWLRRSADRVSKNVALRRLQDDRVDLRVNERYVDTAIKRVEAMEKVQRMSESLADYNDEYDSEPSSAYVGDKSEKNTSFTAVESEFHDSDPFAEREEIERQTSNEPEPIGQDVQALLNGLAGQFEPVSSSVTMKNGSLDGSLDDTSVPF